MHPSKVDRERLAKLTDLPNVGRAVAADLRLLGIQSPADLAGRCALDMYVQLCKKTDVRQDPCVLDVFLSVTSFMNGDPPRPWWEYTDQRKAALAGGMHE